MTSRLDGEVVLEGTWLYAGTVRCRIAIVRRGTWYGTGDYEDPPALADDREVETFEIRFTAAGDPDRFFKPRHARWTGRDYDIGDDIEDMIEESRSASHEDG